MTKAFEDIMDFIKAFGPSPVQYGRNGVLTSSCGSAEGSLGNGCAHPSANLVGAISPAVGIPDPPAGNQAPEPQGDNSLSGASGICAQEEERDGRLDAVAGRVPSLSVELSYLCSNCWSVFLSTGVPPQCELCAHSPVLCPECHLEHMEAGHVTDIDTARAAKF